MNLFSRVLNWHRSNSKKAIVSYFTLAGTYVAYRIVVDEIENRKRRKDGIFKDRHRLNNRRISQGLPALPDDQFDNPEHIKEYKEWKKRNNIT